MNYTRIKGICICSVASGFAADCRMPQGCAEPHAQQLDHSIIGVLYLHYVHIHSQFYIGLSEDSHDEVITKKKKNFSARFRLINSFEMVQRTELRCDSLSNDLFLL